MLTVGIDIGTSYSSISMLDNNGTAAPIKVSNGACAFGDSYSMPSAVFVRDNGDIVIGQLAVALKMKNPSSYKGEFKRELGQDKPYLLGTLHLLPEDLYKEIFVHFKKCAEEAGGEKVGKAYITYPANFSKKKCELLERAAKKAGLLDVELIDEPTAAAYCYCSKGKIKDGDKLLVYDFGGGTFDVALIEYTQNNFKPITGALGIERCGGIDIDRMIFEDIMNSLPGEILEPIRQNENNYKLFNTQVMEICIQAKHQLSTIEEYSGGITAGFEYIDYSLSRNKLNTMISQLVDETLQQVKNIIKNSRLEFKDINTVLLVGGTSRIPYIKEKLEKLTGKPVCRDIDPELAVCAGAAMWKGKNESSSFEKEEDNFILPIYDEVGSFSEGMAAVCVNKKWGYIDKNGNLVIQTMYKEADEFSDGRAKVRLNKNYGLIDKANNPIVLPIYDEIEVFCEDLAKVKLKGKYGFISKTGEVIEPVYEEVDKFSDGMARIRVNGKYGFISKSGEIIEPVYEEADKFSDGMARIRVNGKYGFISKSGEIVEPVYEEADEFSDGMARIKVNGKYGFIDKTGRMVIQPRYRDAKSFSEGMAKFEDSTTSMDGYIDKTGRIVIQPIFELADSFSEGMADFLLKDKWGYIDKTGQIIIKPVYDYTGKFYEGHAEVEIKGKWGIIDKTGKTVVKPEYDFISDFCEGFADVKISGKWGCVDKTGKKVIKPVYDFVGDFSEGLARVELNNKYGIIDKTGNMLIKPVYDFIGDFSEGLARVKVNDKWGFIGKTGDMVIQPVYDGADDFCEGLAAVKINGKWGFIDKNTRGSISAK